MTVTNYLFAKSMYIGGERLETGETGTVQMHNGDYGSYDDVTQKFSLYPTAGGYGMILYVPKPVVTSLLATGVMGQTAGLTGGIPTPH